MELSASVVLLGATDLRCRTPMVEASVIIAAWNAGETVARSIASAMDQTGILTETIVADDASGDDTSARAKAAGARVLRLNENGGPSAARNKALAAAGGAWVAVLDADDVMAPPRLRRMVDLGNRMHADVVLGNFRRVDGAENPIDTDPFLSGPGFENPQIWTLEQFLAGDLLAPGSPSFGYLKPVFRRSFLRECKLDYDVRLRNSEDCHLIFECLAAGARVVFSPPPDYLYTVHKGSISHRISPEHIDALVAADQEFVQRHTEILSQQEKVHFETRRSSLLKLKVSEEVLQALKSLRIKAALAPLLKHPSATGRVFRQLLEAISKRLPG